MKPRTKKHLFKLAVLAGTLFFCALVLEIGLRLFWKQPVFRISQRHYEHEPWPFAFRFKPNQVVKVPFPEIGDMQVQVNEDGFRGPSVSELASHAVRVVSIGDSFTFGWGCKSFHDQCVVGFVDEYRQANPAADVGLSVVAEPGWGSRDYLFGYLGYGRKARPQLVVVGFFCGDDICSPGTVSSIATGTPPDKLWAGNKSFFRCATLDWVRFRVRSSPVLTKAMFSLGARPQSDLIRFLRAEPDPIPQMWRETFQLLAALNEEVRQDGGQLAIVSYPSLIQVFAHQELDDAKFDYRHIDKRLEAFCGEQGIVFVPLLPALEADGKLDLYYARDRHLTPRGHAVARRAIMEKLGPVLDRIRTGTEANRG